MATTGWRRGRTIADPKKQIGHPKLFHSLAELLLAGSGSLTRIVRTHCVQDLRGRMHNFRPFKKTCLCSRSPEEATTGGGSRKEL